MQVNTISEDFEDQMGWKKVFASIHISLRSFSLKPDSQTLACRESLGAGVLGGVKCPFSGPHPQRFRFTIYGVDSAMCIFTKQPHVVLVHLAHPCPREMSVS